MNIGDKVEGVAYPYLGVSGYLIGDAILDSYMYLRTKDDLISLKLKVLHKYFKVIEEADNTKPVRFCCMFS